MTMRTGRFGQVRGCACATSGSVAVMPAIKARRSIVIVSSCGAMA
jgi:hypothetical protein